MTDQFASRPREVLQDREPLVHAIVGCHLTAVEFHGGPAGPILLRFSEGRLEVLAAARLRTPAFEVDARSHAGRLALRDLVSRAVAHVAVEPGRTLELALEGGATLLVSLRAQDRPGGEAAGFFDESWAFEAYA